MLEFKDPEVAKKFTIIGETNVKLQVPNFPERFLTDITVDEADHLWKNRHPFIKPKIGTATATSGK